MTGSDGRLRSAARFAMAAAAVPPMRLVSRARYEIKRLTVRRMPKRLREAVARSRDEPPELRDGYLWGCMPRDLEARPTKGPAPHRSSAPPPQIAVDILGERLVLEQPIDWTPGSKSRLWQFTLNYFDWALPLVGSALREDARPGDEGQITVQTLHEVMLSWIRANPYPLSEAWHPYPTARRLTAWTYLVSALPGLAVPEVERSIWLQLRYLANNVEWFAGGGHLLQSLSSLVVAGLRYGAPKAERIVRHGLHHLCSHLPRQILADGCHYELSSAYHLQNMTRTSEVISCLLAAGYRPPSALVDSLGRMTSFAESIRLPGNDYPQWSDGVRDSVHSIDVVIDLAKAVLSSSTPPGPVASAKTGPRPERLPFPHNGLVTSAAYNPSRRPFPGLSERAVPSPKRRSGLYVLTGRSVSVAFDASDTGAPDVPGHGHADCLNVDVYIDGRPVVIESGTSTYAPSQDRKRERGTAAHNTIELGGRDQSELWGSFRTGRVARATEQAVGDTTGWSWASGCHDGYRTAPSRTTHRRWVGTCKGDVVVLDQLAMDPAGVATGFVLRMHFAPAVTLRECGRMTFLISNADDQRFLEFLGVTPKDESRALQANDSGSRFAPGMGQTIPRGLVELGGEISPGEVRYVATVFSSTKARYQLASTDRAVRLHVAGKPEIEWRKVDGPLVPVAIAGSESFDEPGGTGAARSHGTQEPEPWPA